jgi:hypothetical protein
MVFACRITTSLSDTNLTRYDTPQFFFVRGERALQKSYKKAKLIFIGVTMFFTTAFMYQHITTKHNTYHCISMVLSPLVLSLQTLKRGAGKNLKSKNGKTMTADKTFVKFGKSLFIFHVISFLSFLLSFCHFKNK